MFTKNSLNIKSFMAQLATLSTHYKENAQHCGRLQRESNSYSLWLLLLLSLSSCCNSRLLSRNKRFSNIEKILTAIKLDGRNNNNNSNNWQRTINKATMTQNVKAPRARAQTRGGRDRERHTHTHAHAHMHKHSGLVV